MPLKIINALSDANNSIAESLKSVGQSIWGDEAKNEGLRQNAEKLRQEAAKAARENSSAEPYARSLRDNDAPSARYYGALHGLTPEGTAVANRLAVSGHANGNMYDPELGTAMLGAGASAASTPQGHRETLENARMQPTYGITDEDPRTGAKNYGWRDPRTMTTQPNAGFGQPAPQGAPMQPGGGFNTPPANPAAPQASYTPADLLTDEHGQPMATQPAPLHMAQSAVDENGQPMLSSRGQQALEAVRQKYGDGYAGRVLGTILGHNSAPASRSRANNAFMDDVYSVYPNFDAGVNAMRNATYKDIALSGKTGQVGMAIDQGIRHMGEQLIPQAVALDTWPSGKFGPLTHAANSLYTAKLAGEQDPRLAGFNVAKEGFANEFAKIFRTQGQMAEPDIEAQRRNFTAAQTPQELQAVVKSAIGLMHGSLQTREAAINRVLGADSQRPPMISPETAQNIAQIEAWAGGGAVPHFGKQGAQLPQGVPSAGGGNQPATAVPPAQPQGAQPPAAAPGPQPMNPLEGVDPKAIQYLQQHPETRAFFDRKYGAGTAAHVLGQ